MTKIGPLVISSSLFQFEHLEFDLKLMPTKINADFVLPIRYLIGPNNIGLNNAGFCTEDKKAYIYVLMGIFIK